MRQTEVWAATVARTGSLRCLPYYVFGERLANCQFALQSSHPAALYERLTDAHDGGAHQQSDSNSHKGGSSNGKNVFQQTWIRARVGDRDCVCWLPKTSGREPASRSTTPFHPVEVRRLCRALRFRRRVQAGRRRLACAERRLEAQGR